MIDYHGNKKHFFNYPIELFFSHLQLHGNKNATFIFCLIDRIGMRKCP